MRRFFEAAAADWDERVKPDGDVHLAPLAAAIEELRPAPARILDVGTGTGAAAMWFARRFGDAEVLGVDVSSEMISRARAKATDRVRFEIADTSKAAAEGPFDLIVHLKCPVLFGDVPLQGQANRSLLASFVTNTVLTSTAVRPASTRSASK